MLRFSFEAIGLPTKKLKAFIYVFAHFYFLMIVENNKRKICKAREYQNMFLLL